MNRSRRRLHLADPRHSAGQVYEGFERGDRFLATQCNTSEAFEFVEETLNQVPFLVECPIDVSAFTAGRVAFDVRCCAKIIGDECPQMIGIVGSVHDDMLRCGQTFDQPTRLRAVTPLSGRDYGSDRQPKRIHRSVDFGGQAAFGATNTGSFKPPF